MCDTNVILDVFLDRVPFSTDSSKVLDHCALHLYTGFTTASCITDIYYFVYKYLHDREATYDALGQIFSILNVCDVTAENIADAYKQRAKDFEDCLLAVCAKSINCDCIVTRNKKDFAEFGIPTYTPTEILRMEIPS